jgi:HEPN domain-containing protein
MERGDFPKAAFELHQAVERLYGAFLLVYSRYKPSTHDLEELGKRVASIEPRTLEVFPQGTPEERLRLQLLRKAYVDARYKPSYQITREDLEWLEARVLILKQLTESLCRQKIASFAGT